MAPETQLRTALIADAALSALVGARIYAGLIPQNSVMPAIAFERISTQPRDSAMGKDTGYVQATVQYTCIAENDAHGAGYDQAAAVAEALRHVVQRFRSAGPVLEVFIDGELVTYEPDTLRHSRVLDIDIRFLES